MTPNRLGGLAEMVSSFHQKIVATRPTLAYHLIALASWAVLQMEELILQWLEYECALPFAWPDEQHNEITLRIELEIELRDSLDKEDTDEEK